MNARSALALFLAACACAAPRPGGEPRSTASSARVVAESELPELEREVLHAWRAGGVEWDTRRASVAADPRLARFLVDNLVRDMVRAYDRSKLARDGEAEGPFERACAELVRFASHSAPICAQMLDLEDGVVAFLAADVLARIGELALDPVARQLAAPREETRRRAAELLARLPHAGAREMALQQSLAELGERDPAWIVRAQACRALGIRGALHDHKGFALGVLLRALRDADEAVAESAGAAVRDLGEVRAIPGLIQALQRASHDGRPLVVRSIEAALSALSGEKRQRSIAGWLEWWSHHEARLSSGAR